MKKEEPIPSPTVVVEPTPATKAAAAQTSSSASSPTPLPQLSPFRSLLSAHFAQSPEFPETDFSDDAVAEQYALRYVRELQQQLERFSTADDRLSELLAQNPPFAQFMQAVVLQHSDPAEALSSLLTPELLGRAVPAFQSWQNSEPERQLQARQWQERNALLDANQQQSLEAVAQFCQQQNLTEAQQQALLQMVNEDFSHLLDKCLTPSMLKGYLRRLTFEEEMQQARHQGELDGRNANIEAQMAQQQVQTQGDGLPQASTSGGYNAKMLSGKQPVIDFSKY